MKKTLILASIGILLYAILYYFTNSFKISLVAFIVLILYIGIETLITIPPSKKEREEHRKNRYLQNTSKLNKAKKDNPTIR